MYLAHKKSPKTIGSLLGMSERSVRRYITMFYQVGDVKPRTRRNGPMRLLGDFEQLILLRLILDKPGIYLHELQTEFFQMFGVSVSVSTICRTLRRMECTRQAMHHVALQRSDTIRAKFMANISKYDPSMFVWLDESGFDRRQTIRKYAYSMRGIPLEDHRILVRGTRYSAIPIMSLEGIHDVYITQDTVNGDKFTEFISNNLLPILLPFNYVNPRSIVIMDNASIHHVEEVRSLIEDQAGAKLCYLPPYSPDLMPAEGVFSQVKSIMKANHKIFEVCTVSRILIAMVFSMVTRKNCYGHISRCGYL